MYAVILLMKRLTDAGALNLHPCKTPLWTGTLDISQLDPRALPLLDIQIWGHSSWNFSSTKNNSTSEPSGRVIGGAEILKECEKEFDEDGWQLSAVACIDVASIGLWMVSGPVMDVFTSNAATEEFFKSVVASSDLRYMPILSRGIIVKLSPPMHDITRLVIFGHVSPSPTTIASKDSMPQPRSFQTSAPQLRPKVSIKALPLNSSCRLGPYICHKRKRKRKSTICDSFSMSSNNSNDESHENKKAIFLDESVEDVSSAQKRNEKLEQLLRRRTRQESQSQWHSRDGSVSHDDSQQTEGQNIVAEVSLLGQQLNLSQQTRSPEPTGQSVPHCQSVDQLGKASSRNETSRTQSTLQRVLLSALRLRGISRQQLHAAKGEGEERDPDVEMDYKELYHHAYRAALFALVCSFSFRL
ncbi:hypothetical protein V1517DRAFT_65345 [Lipomyces orientalis]|uniref:Uncharacterized protein n=1 Tax=Lipomyces orientalis TaxID=1233043 RepID=A0ACC3TST9_9ASCO